MQKTSGVYPIIKSITIGTVLSIAVHGAAYADTSLPKLEIVADCGECVINDNVRAEIEKAYVDQAQKGGLQINQKDKANLRITEYLERSSGARIMFGMLAGKDLIKASLSYKDAKHEVEDTARSALNGIGAVASEVGKQAYVKLSGKPVIYDQASEQ